VQPEDDGDDGQFVDDGGAAAVFVEAAGHGCVEGGLQFDVGGAFDAVIADAMQGVEDKLRLGGDVGCQRAKVFGVGQGEGDHVCRAQLDDGFGSLVFFGHARLLFGLFIPSSQVRALSDRLARLRLFALIA
jgi:hypothetical protein